MDPHQILGWLRESDPARLNELWRRADGARQRYVGGQVHLRGLIEFSNHCVRLCAYCGLRAPNVGLKRYRMTADEILICARQAVAFGYGAVVLQSGEDPGTEAEWMADVIRRIKAETPLAVTQPRRAERRRSGRLAGRRRRPLPVTLRDLEPATLRPPASATHTSQGDGSSFVGRKSEQSPRIDSPVLTGSPLPPAGDGQKGRGVGSDRLAILRTLRELGYEVGSGVMIGIPGQTYDDLAATSKRFGQLDLDMIGVGPFLLHPDTPLGDPDFRPLVPAATKCRAMN